VKPRGHFIPFGGIKRRLCTDRIILAGDAAGFVDPFYGEGLAYAIRSGQIAAETALTAAQGRGSPRASLVQYERRTYEAFGKNLRYALLLTRLAHRWPSVFFRMLSSDQQVLQHYVLVPAMKVSYRRYVQWLLMRTPLFLLQTFSK